jgi:hypothetical protein
MEQSRPTFHASTYDSKRYKNAKKRGQLLWLRNLPYKLSKECLDDIVRGKGFTNLNIYWTDPSKEAVQAVHGGWVYLQLPSPEAAKKAFRELQGLVIDRRRVLVQWAIGTPVAMQTLETDTLSSFAITQNVR